MTWGAPARSFWTLEDQIHPRAAAITATLRNDVDLSEPQRAQLGDELAALLRSDFPTFCGLLLRVKPKGGGFTTPFLFFNSQRIVWAAMQSMMEDGLGVFLVVLKFRQAGISTLICAWVFWQAWRQRDVLGMTIAHARKTAEMMIEIMRVFYDELPAVDNVKPRLRTGNQAASLPRGELYFADRRSGVMLHIAKDMDPRGPQASHVHESEFASYPNPYELNGALLPQLPARGTPGRSRCSFIIESTPKGQNAFYNYYMRAKEPDSEWRAVFLPWFVQEEEYSLPLSVHFELTDREKFLRKLYSRERRRIDGKDVTPEQMFWRRMFILDEYHGDEDRFDQEFPSDDKSCFLLLSENLFKRDMRFLNDCVQGAKERAIDAWQKYGHTVTRAPHVRVSADKNEIKFALDSHGPWIVWEPPVLKHVYVVGGDVCAGLGNPGNDNSVGCVLDVTEGRQVAEYALNIKPETFGNELDAIGRWYNNALMVPEVNNLGYVVLKTLIHDRAYPNMYRWPKWDEVNRYSHKRGWETNERTKLLMMSSLVSAVEERSIEIASPDLLSEMSTFERVGDEYQAQDNAHDDRVMAFALALMGIQQTPKLAAVWNSTKKAGLPSTRAMNINAAAADDTLPKALQERIAAAGSIRDGLCWDPIGAGI